MKRVAFIGFGNMGSAIAMSIKDSCSIKIYDIDKDKVSSSGFKSEESIDDALSGTDIAIIAVKPQVIDKAFLASIKRKDLSYISIAAGITLSSLEANLETKNIARFMPNLAAREKKAVTAICYSDGADEAFKNDCFEIACSFGSAFSLDESSFGAFIGASGSLIAYALEFISSSAMAATSIGIPYKSAESIVKDTLFSALSLLSDGTPAAALIPLICSAKGTTIRGIEALKENGFESAIYKAVRAAAERSDELEKESKERLA